MTITAVSPSPTEELPPLEELRAQYVACSYLATACQDALGRFPPPSLNEAADRVALRALELMLAIEWDWRVTLRQLAEKLGKAASGDGSPLAPDTSTLDPVTYIHAEDPGPARESSPPHRTDYRRRPSVRRRL